MGEFFAHRDPARYESHTRSVRLAGHATSIRLEKRFWEIVDEIAARQGQSTPRFLSRLYEEALESQGHISNFASLLRCVCVGYLSSPDATLGPDRIQEKAAGRPLAE